MSCNNFTPREQELMAFAWQCFEGEPKVNYQKLADLAGMSNPVSASNAWAKIKKKLAGQAAAANGGANRGANDSSASSEKKSKTPAATPNKRKKRVDSVSAGDDEESPSKKPKPTPKKGGKTAAAKKKEANDEVDGESWGDGVMVKGEEEEEDEFN